MLNIAPFSGADRYHDFQGTSLLMFVTFYDYAF